MIRITMSHPVSPLTAASYPASMEDVVISNLESAGYTIIMVETL
jgi:hypothetical protein